MGAGCLFVLLWIEGKEAVSRARPVLQGRVKTHCQDSHGARDTPLPRTQPWKNEILIAPEDALAESWGGCSASEGHQAAAIAAVTSPCGLSRPAETPTPHTHPAAQGQGKLGGHGTGGLTLETGNQGRGRNDRLLPGLLCLSLLPREGCPCCSASTCVLSFLWAFPTSARSLCLVVSPSAQGHFPTGHQGHTAPAAPGAQGEPAALCPHASSLVPTGPVTCPGSQGKAPEFAHSTGLLGRQGQRLSPGGQVPSYSSQDPGGQTLSALSACLRLPGSPLPPPRKASVASRKCSPPKASGAEDCWQRWGGGGQAGLFLYWDWAPVGPCNVLDTILTLKRTRLQSCVTSPIPGQTLTGKKADHGGHRQDQRPAKCHTEEAWSRSAPRREQLILHPPGIGEGAPADRSPGSGF